MRFVLSFFLIGALLLVVIGLTLPHNKEVAEAAKVAKEESRRFPWLVLGVTVALLGLLALSNLFVNEQIRGVVLLLDGLYLFLVLRLAVIALGVYLAWQLFLRLVLVAQSLGAGLKGASSKK